MQLCTMGTLSLSLGQIKSLFSMHLEMPCSCGFQAKNFHAPSLEYIGIYKEGIAQLLNKKQY